MGEKKKTLWAVTGKTHCKEGINHVYEMRHLEKGSKMKNKKALSREREDQGIDSKDYFSLGRQLGKVFREGGRPLRLGCELLEVLRFPLI